MNCLILAAILFGIGIMGVLLNRNNILILLMSIELILLAVNTNFIVFSKTWHHYAGQICALFILTVAAAETAIGLAILISFYRQKATVAVDHFNTLQG